jgi:hypothetical protein
VPHEEFSPIMNWDARATLAEELVEFILLFTVGFQPIGLFDDVCLSSICYGL